MVAVANTQKEVRHSSLKSVIVLVSIYMIKIQLVIVFIPSSFQCLCVANKDREKKKREKNCKEEKCDSLTEDRMSYEWNMRIETNEKSRNDEKKHTQ